MIAMAETVVWLWMMVCILGVLTVCAGFEALVMYKNYKEHHK